MNNSIIKFISKIKTRTNPNVISSDISSFILSLLRKNQVSLYEAYLLNGEKIRFKRFGYIKPAWNRGVQITNCIDILNQKFIADIFNESINSKKYLSWAQEAYKLNKDKRRHYILKRFDEYLNINKNKELLEYLMDIRKHYKELDYDDGPYHTECFPYDFYSPEEILINPDRKEDFCKNKYISEDIENLMVELYLIEQ